MASLGFLLLLTLFGIVQSSTTTVINNCTYNVSFTRTYIPPLPKLPTYEVRTLPPGVSAEFDVDITTLMVETYRFSTGCKKIIDLNIDPLLHIETGSELCTLDSGCLCEGCCLQTPLESEVLLRHAGFYSLNKSSYQINNKFGYSIPLRVSTVGNDTFNFLCEDLNCRLSLDDCPKNESYGIGDLRVRKENKTIACTSPCTKQSYPPPTGKGEQRRADCTFDKYPQLQYVQLLRDKCDSFLATAIDDRLPYAECQRSYALLPSFNIVTCP